MTGLPFPWIFTGLAAIVDVVGLLYLWRRRNSGVRTNYRVDRSTPLRIPLAERRRRERRGTGKAVAV